MTKKRNPRVLMREKAVEIGKSVTWLKNNLQPPSLYFWRASPDGEMKTTIQHGTTRPRSRADVQSWEHIENNPRDLKTIIGVSRFVAQQANELQMIAQARLDELEKM